MTGLLCVTHCSIAEPGDGLDDQTRRDFSPAEHDIADTHLGVDEVSNDTMIDAFVATAQQAEPVECRQLVRG